MQEEGKQGKSRQHQAVTQKALSWFNGCEVLPPLGPRSCWCLIRTNIHLKTQHLSSGMAGPERRRFNPSPAIAGGMSYKDGTGSCRRPAQRIHSSSNMEAIKFSPGSNVKSETSDESSSKIIRPENVFDSWGDGERFSVTNNVKDSCSSQCPASVFTLWNVSHFVSI